MRKLAALITVVVLCLVGINLQQSDSVEGAFIESMTVPWPSSFVPGDSAWDSSGNYCLVVGNDTASTPNQNVWAYNSANGNWAKTNATTGSTASDTSVTYYVGSGAGNYSAAIQPAIDAASSGDTVFVWAGTYRERITIDLAINLTGQNRNTTIIDGQSLGNVVLINSDWVNISRFTIQNGSGGSVGVYFNTNVDYCSVYANRITGNGYGMYMYFANNNNIVNNIITLNSNDGIYLTDSDNNLFEKNTLSSNTGSGITLNWADANTLRGSTVIGNGYIGVYVWSSNGNSVHNNNIIANAVLQASDNSGANIWNLDKNQGGGNHWSDWTTPDGGDGFVPNPRPISGGIGMDQYPWVLEDGWVGEIIVDGPGGINRRVNDDPGLTMQRAPSLAIGADGTIYAAWEDTRNGNSDIYFAKSIDGGLNFGLNVRVNNVITSEQTAPSLAKDNLTGNIYIAWEDMSSGNLDIYFSRSTDGGLTFFNSIKVNNDGGTAIQSGPSVAVGPDGTMYVAWADYRGGDSDIYFAKSTNNGLSFGSNNRVDSAPGGSDQQRPSVAAYATNVYFTWHDVRTGNTDIYFRMSPDHGNTFGTETKLNNDPGTAGQSFPDIAVGPEGNIYAAWQDGRNGNLDIYFTRSTDNGMIFGPNLRLDNDNSAATEQIRASVAVGPSGYVYIAWEDSRDGNLARHIYMARSTDSGASFEVNKKFTSEPGSKTQPSLAVHPNGKVYCAWGDNRVDTSDVFFAKYVEFASIQLAINAARPMWTVWVMPGTYPERLNINKRITLEGQDRLTTIVNAGGVSNVINVTASNVHISTISLTNTGNYGWGVNINTASNCHISYTTINTYYGLLMIYGTGGHLIENNDITAQIALQLEVIDGNTIQSNNLMASNCVINLYTSHNNMFKYNMIRECVQQAIYIESSNQNTFLGNTIFNNNYGIYIDSGNGNLFYRNNFMGNNVHAEDWPGSNFWNLALPGGGNYWDDWTVPDANGDSIVDNPRAFTGGSDNFPWVKANGWIAPDWILIHDVWELQAMNNNLTASYALANDIDASITSGWNGGAGFLPVGFSGTYFTGCLDGRGFKITGLTISRTSTMYGVGLFGAIQYGSYIYDLGLEGAVIHGGQYASAALAGYSDGYIARCYSIGTITGSTYSYVGGLVGSIGPEGIVTNSYSMASVSGNDDVGGLAGRSFGTISNCYSTGAVLSGTNRGGLLGQNLGGYAVTASFYDRETSGRTDTGKGDPKFTVEMKTQATFTSAGWDFTAVWQMQEGVTYPLLRKPGQTGGSDPYPPLRGATWDWVNNRFLVCGKTGGSSSVYYIRPQNMSAMIPITDTPAFSFNAIASDSLGNFLVGGEGLDGLYYYDNMGETWITVPESVTGSMADWNVTGITFNGDDRFFIVGNVMNQDKGAAFFTDIVALEVGSLCYRDTSAFMNSPGIGSLKAISWNDWRYYGLAVGDGVYRVDNYDDNPANELQWTVIGEPTAGNSFYDVSFDSDGWNEAGIVGSNQTYGNYWRYYDTNPQLIQGYKDPVSGTKYRTCAMKPPASPKWLIIPHAGGCVRVGIMEKDESGVIQVDVNEPHIFAVDMWRQDDPGHISRLNTQAEVDSVYTFFIEGNYTVNGISQWNSLIINLAAWFDFGVLASDPGDPSWSLGNYRTIQFNASYNVGLATMGMVYPLPVAPAGEEFEVASYWNDPAGYGADGNTRRMYINMSFGPQTIRAPGQGAMIPAGNTWDEVTALNDMFTWDFRVHMYDSTNPNAWNMSYNEFGVEQYASLAVSGNPSGSIPPGSVASLAQPSVISYSSNAQYQLNVSIPNLHRNGNPLLEFISVGFVQVLNNHSNANAGNSNISAWQQFLGENQAQIIWGFPGSWIQPVGSGTVSAGPMYSDYTAAMVPEPFEVTRVWWSVEVPAGTLEGIYRATITITICI